MGSDKAPVETTAGAFVVPEKRRRKTRAAPARPATVERTNVWNGFSKGQAVELNSPWKGRNRYGRFVFRAHCRHLETGAEWVELFGGKSGHPLERAFPIQAIKPHR